jgi:hypothetical protein
MGSPLTQGSWQVKYKDNVAVQHYGAFEEPQHSLLKLDDERGNMTLRWTHSSNEHLYDWMRFTITLTSFVCCGYCDVNDPQAPDLTPPEASAKHTPPPGGYTVPQEHGFWVHSPERQRTFYFYARSMEEQEMWVQNIRHNLEVLRSRPGADAEIMAKCEETLVTNGYTEHEIRRWVLNLVPCARSGFLCVPATAKNE